MNDTEALTVQAATADTLARLLAALPVRTVRERPSPDKWSVNEIVAHLADAEIVTGFRLRWILGAPGSAVAAYDQDAWVTSGHYDVRDPTMSIAHFRMAREANLALLASLTPDQWQQHGMHSDRGRETIEQIVCLTAGHDSGHVRQIERILAATRT